MFDPQTMIREHVNLKTENVLVCLRYGIGDLIMELPVLEELRSALCASRITALGAEPAINLLENSGIADRLVSYSRWGISDWYTSGTKEISLQIRRWLKEEKFDLVFDAYHTPPVVRNELYGNCPNALDYHEAAQNRILILGGDGITAIKEGIMRGWGLKVKTDSVPRLKLTQEELEFADVLISALPSQGTLIGISVDASSPLKTWPEQNFIQVINSLTLNGDCSFVLLAGPQQQNHCQAVWQKLAAPEHTIVLCNLHLRKIAAILSRCSAFVGNDSGLMHIAAAAGTPGVVIFGPTDANVYLPRWINSLAARAEINCPYRKTAGFGHAACVIAGRCLTGQNCISEPSVESVCGMIREVTKLQQCQSINS